LYYGRMMMVKRRWRGGLVVWVEWWLKMSMQCCGEKRGSQKRRWIGGLVAWMECWLKMIMQCCGEKTGLHIVVRKG
jgi:hypothetical protein